MIFLKLPAASSKQTTRTLTCVRNLPTLMSMATASSLVMNLLLHSETGDRAESSPKKTALKLWSSATRVVTDVLIMKVCSILYFSWFFLFFQLIFVFYWIEFVLLILDGKLVSYWNEMYSDIMKYEIVICTLPLSHSGKNAAPNIASWFFELEIIADYTKINK